MMGLPAPVVLPKTLLRIVTGAPGSAGAQKIGTVTVGADTASECGGQPATESGRPALSPRLNPPPTVAFGRRSGPVCVVRRTSVVLT